MPSVRHVSGQSMSIAKSWCVSQRGASERDALAVSRPDRRAVQFSGPVIPGLAAGTKIKGAGGEVDVADLRPGDPVLTRDNGYQALRFCGPLSTTAAFMEGGSSSRPIRVRAGALGSGRPERDVLISPMQRILVSGSRVKKLAGMSEMLVAAGHLSHLNGIDRVDSPAPAFVAIAFDHHELVMANGLWMESLSADWCHIDAVTVGGRKGIERDGQTGEQDRYSPNREARRTLPASQALMLA
ncbi:Hint domain-containing protein [Thalassococcus sp. CAU 1522]|uniref:Hint domain-containing protein n=1 Tax=Thalassococcus arenae TaxID=2851652 RepID=A0ABS6N6L0_9RHOB|nr:Hint domain-containing protein [Thalassococcus arenae]MBV2359652.1 Hint domain-containing protein [Thalassococcus arenae]